MNSGTVSHTATQARLIIIIFFFVCLFFFFGQIFTRVSMFSGVTLYRSQYIELLLKCLAAGKKLTCTNKHVIG